MNVGPLRRITAATGLLALTPITWLLAVDAVTPEQAAIRAMIVAVVVVLLGNVMRTILQRMLHRLERRATDAAAQDSLRSTADPVARSRRTEDR